MWESTFTYKQQKMGIGAMNSHMQNNNNMRKEYVFVKD